MNAVIRLNAVTKADRNALISGIGDAVTNAGGWIEDVHFFSNISIALHFVMLPHSGISLAAGLSLQPMTFDADDLAKLTALGATGGNEEINCTIQITFFHDDPDLRRYIPSVPG